MTVSTIKNKLLLFCSVVLCCAIYEILAYAVDSDLILPHLNKVLSSLFYLAGTKEFIFSVLITFGRVIAVFCAALVAGIILGFLSGLFPSVKTLLSVPMGIIRATPVIAFILVCLYMFDSGVLPFICGVLMALPVVTDSVSKGVENASGELLEMANVFRFSKYQRIRYVYFSSVKVHLIGCAETVFGMSWKVVVSGEILSVPKNALGTILQDQKILSNSDNVMALVFVIIFLCVFSQFLFKHLFRFFSFVYHGLSRKSFQTAEISSDFFKGCSSVEIEDVNFSYEKQLIFRRMNIKLSGYNCETENAPFTITRSLTFPDCFDVQGRSGCGKSTFLKILSSRFNASQVFQNDVLIPSLSVIENVALPLYNITGRDKALDISYTMLKKCGLESKIYSCPQELSGGEKQRVNLTRGLCFPSDILLLDEAFNSLDEKTYEEVKAVVSEELIKRPRITLNVVHKI